MFCLWKSNAISELIKRTLILNSYNYYSSYLISSCEKGNSINQPWEWLTSFISQIIKIYSKITLPNCLSLKKKSINLTWVCNSAPFPLYVVNLISVDLFSELLLMWLFWLRVYVYLQSLCGEVPAGEITSGVPGAQWEVGETQEADAGFHGWQTVWVLFYQGWWRVSDMPTW